MCSWTMGYVSEKLGVWFFFWEPWLGAWRTAVISGSSLLQVLIPAQQWSTYTLVSLEIACFSTHTSSVDFPSMSLEIACFSTHTSSVDFPSISMGSGASLQDSLCFVAYNQSWNSQVHASKAGSIYPHNTRYMHTFQTHGPMPHPRSPRCQKLKIISLQHDLCNKAAQGHWVKTADRKLEKQALSQ